MTEITRVPLLPIARGSLAKIWLAVVLVIAAGVWLSGIAMPALVRVQTLQAGEGPSPGMGDVAIINYKGTLKDGTVFDEQQQAPLPLQGVVPGFTKALMQMQAGGKYHVLIPSKLGYGDHQVGPIPPNSDLNFDIELVQFMPVQEFQQRIAMMRQMQMQQAQKGGPPHGGPGGVPGEMPPGAGPPEGMPPQ
ncbi:MAG: FKBP-type peptidyl-prolyl cis-trans isomerase [Novosphingobium sp.]